MKTFKIGRILILLITALLLAVIGGEVFSPPQKSGPPAVRSFTPNAEASADAIADSTTAIRFYGIVYPYPPGLWTEADRAAIGEQLETLHTMGVDTILQVFASRPAGPELENGWLIFLDEAERAGVRVIARVYPADERAWYGFRLKTIRRFLNVTGQHPAMLAYQGLHEPLEDYTSRQLQRFYRAMKRIAPDLPVAHMVGDIVAFDRNLRFPNREFAPDICDICIVFHYPAQSADDRMVFDEQGLQTLLRGNLQLAAQRDPGAQIWLLGQAFSQEDSRYSFRMPTPEEMQAIFTLAQKEGVDGFLWYPWIHDAYEQVLGDAGSQAQQEAVRQIAEKRATPQPDREAQ